ncbi:hypothetical protein BUALT_Bualt09G0070300 [Buddleja alternifolia]|uniref:Glycosyl transferase CAP10 domain-containing protein n=1 Tax=Buddleja alternifolia TaxID=168488 RepID=A0AAV6X8P7_9LAMI|nr:hypothetical protein BUALT_Bualt09G0070300 [Buddleja alternifolia]
MVERANKTANYRLVVLNGRAYLETYDKGFQTRDTFMLWGILQLLRWYPGNVPDLDMMFDCVDWPVIKSSDYQGPQARSRLHSLDIVAMIKHLILYFLIGHFGKDVVASEHISDVEIIKESVASTKEPKQLTGG